MAHSHIEWTQMTWNPTTGCNKISAGCKFCYAEVMTKRLKGMGQEKYANGFKLTTHELALNIPYSWKQPKIVFVNSMSDLFHEEVPLDFIKRVFDVMNDCPQHIFQVLTKRGEILKQHSSQLQWGSNIWMGVTVESERFVDRIDCLRSTGAKIKFLSCEPLLSALPNLNLINIDWVIVGGESGRMPRPIKEEWVLDIQKQCLKSETKFFFKQWGGVNKKASGRLLQGKTWDDMPVQYSNAV